MYSPKPGNSMHACTQVLEAASAGNFNARPLHFGEALSDRVDKSGCHYYTLELQQSHIDSGFVIGAHSAAGSKFKLLMFGRTADSPGDQWELVIQEDSMKVTANEQKPLLILVITDTSRSCTYCLCSRLAVV